MGKKICTKCSDEKLATFEFFYHCAANKDGFTFQCKVCSAKEQRLKREKDLEAARKKDRDNARKFRKRRPDYWSEYRNNNRSLFHASAKRSYRKDIERSRRYHREYDRKERQRNPEAVRARENKRRHANKERYAIKNKQYREKNDDRIYLRRLERTYGLSADDYGALLEAQQHRCAICRGKEIIKTKEGKVKRLSIDHHGTNEVRGILCNRCNNMLGNSEDSQDILLAAVEYLLYYNQQPRQQVALG